MIINNQKDVEKFLEICEKSTPIQTNSDSKILSKDESNTFLNSEKFIKRYQPMKIKTNQVYICFDSQQYYIVERIATDFKTSEEFVVFKPVNVFFEDDRSYYDFDDKSSTPRYILRVDDFIKDFEYVHIDLCRINCENSDSEVDSEEE